MTLRGKRIISKEYTLPSLQPPHPPLTPDQLLLVLLSTLVRATCQLGQHNGQWTHNGQQRRHHLAVHRYHHPSVVVSTDDVYITGYKRRATLLPSWIKMLKKWYYSKSLPLCHKHINKSKIGIYTYIHLTPSPWPRRQIFF